MSILTLHDLTLTIGNAVLLDHVDWQIQTHDRIALVGRNGAGKSTLLRLLQGELVADSGQMHQRNGLIVAGLTQDVPLDEAVSVYDFLVKPLGDLGALLLQYRLAVAQNNLDEMASCQQKMDNWCAWEWLPRIEMMASHLQLNLDAKVQTLSGGLKRRALLAAALIANPDLLLLDEPTNHLDMETIEWLESYLKQYQGSLVVVTHDRAFLANVANRIVQIDRGKLYSHDCDYETYLDRREANLVAEQRHNELFDKRLQEEEAWLRTGVKARRTRNEGRVRALKAMREAHRQRRNSLGQVKSLTLDSARSGQLVLEASQLSYQIQNKYLIRDFSLLITRGDKLGVIGPNGCGKTTLVRLLLGEIKPSTGEIRSGTSLQVAYFDQLRRQLDEQQTVMANVADGADYVTINGKQKHVASYLRDFLFQPESFNQPVSALSGGEKNRLLLAKIFAKPVNLLVMDEPTNDLDIETLELLETMLIEYTGTLILISHDRAFINQVVTSVLVYEGEGHFNEYLGDYDTYRNLQQQKMSNMKPVTNSVKPRIKTSKLSSNEQRELSRLPQQIEQIEKQIHALHLEMTNPTFYSQEASKITAVNQQLTQYETNLAKLYERWEILETKKMGESER